MNPPGSKGFLFLVFLSVPGVQSSCLVNTYHYHERSLTCLPPHPSGLLTQWDHLTAAWSQSAAALRNLGGAQERQGTRAEGVSTQPGKLPGALRSLTTEKEGGLSSCLPSSHCTSSRWSTFLPLDSLRNRHIFTTNSPLAHAC